MATSAISFDRASFAKIVARYGAATERTLLVTKGVVEWAMDEGIKEAQHQIDTLVYDAPLPPSAGAGYQRSGDTRRAIRRMPGFKRGELPLGSATGAIHVDSSAANRNGFYYPAVLNRGRTDVRYWPRPFWSATKAIMAVRYASQGKTALAALGRAIRME